MRFATIAVAAAGLTILAAAAIHANAHLRAAWAGRRARPRTGPALGRIARLVLAETVAAVWLAVAALRPARLPLGDPAGARRSLLLIAPAWLPMRALTVLGRRLAGGGALVGLARLAPVARPAGLARVAARAEALTRDRPDRPLAVICYGHAATAASALGAMLPRGMLRRLVMLAPPEGTHPAAPDAVSIRAIDDPWQHTGRGAPPADVEIVGVGRLALLVAPHVADVIADLCPSLPCPRSEPTA